MDTLSKDRNYVIENGIDSIRVIIQRPKKWLMLLISITEYLIDLIFLPIGVYLLIRWAAGIFPQYLSVPFGVVLICLSIFILYRKFIDNGEYLANKEIIEFRQQYIFLEKFILGIKLVRKIKIENIKGITISIAFNLMRITPLRWLPFLSKDVDGLIVWKRSGFNKAQMIGRGLSQIEAKAILDNVLSKFPQYRYTQ